MNGRDDHASMRSSRATTRGGGTNKKRMRDKRAVVHKSRRRSSSSSSSKRPRGIRGRWRGCSRTTQGGARRTAEEIEQDNEHARFTDPISQLVFRHPVTVAGEDAEEEEEMYEDATIREWLRTHHTSPITRAPLSVGMLRPASPRFMRDLERYVSSRDNVERYAPPEAAAAGPLVATPTVGWINDLLRGAGPRAGGRIQFDVEPMSEEAYVAQVTFPVTRYKRKSWGRRGRRAEQTLAFSRPATEAEAVDAAADYLRTPMTEAFFDELEDQIVRDDSIRGITFENYADVEEADDVYDGDRRIGAALNNQSVEIRHYEGGGDETAIFLHVMFF